MTQQHTGKKRRKEVREAIDLQRMVKTTTIALVIIFVAGLALTTVFSGRMLATGALAADSMMATDHRNRPVRPAPAGRHARAQVVRAAHGVQGPLPQGHIVTKEDMHALERGEL